MQDTMGESSSPGPQKQKKTRRRLRVSCVECTRRRQKCDRQQPCTLCKNRGVEHLCRWELEPFARPSPARPPATLQTERQGTPGEQTSNVASSPEATISEPIRASPSLVTVPAVAGTSGSHLDTVSSGGHLDHDVKEAAITLAQLSVARHGEYLGAGSLVAALHRLDDQISTKIPTEKSSNIPFSASSQYTSSISSTFTASLQHLILSIPEKKRCDELLAAFFENDNWFYGIPKTLIYKLYTRMWDTVQADLRSLIRIDFHWMTFLFIMFAVSSGCTSEEESRKYYLQALTGKRLADDLLSASFVNPRQSTACSQGTALACMAAGLLAQYLSERGQMTEAWKTVGNAVRNAQNCGLHLNPAWIKWKDMDEDEKQLRIRAWYLVSCKDRFLSFVLGRPAMIRNRDTNVPLPRFLPATLSPDGSTDVVTVCCTAIYLMVDIISEEKDKYLSVRPDPSDGGASFDAKMDAWEASLPSYFAIENPDTSLDHIYPDIVKQRCANAGYYYAYRMLFHRSLSSTMPVFDLPENKLPAQFQMDYAKIAGYAAKLLRVVIAFTRCLGPAQRQVSFQQSFMVFEAAITLTIALLREGGSPEAMRQWQEERDGAICMLEAVKDKDNGDIVRQALQVLKMLQSCRPSSASTGTSGHARAGGTGSGVTTVRTEIASAPGTLTQALEASGPAGLSQWPGNESTFTWPRLEELTTGAAPSTLPPELFSSLDIPMDWFEESMNGTVSAFDLLHSVHNGTSNFPGDDLFRGL